LRYNQFARVDLRSAGESFSALDFDVYASAHKRFLACLRGDVKRILLRAKPDGDSVLRVVAFAALGAFVLALAGCNSPPPHKDGTAKAIERKPTVVELPESTGVTLAGSITGPPSAKLDEGLEVWYRDAGNAVVLVTRSENRVLLHVDVNQNGKPDNGLDVSYGPGDGSSVCAQYSRPPWAPTACGEFKTLATVDLRKNGRWWDASWRLPKSELGSAVTGDLSFEIFDERNQSSRYYPGAPFTDVARVKFSNPPSTKSAPSDLTPPAGRATAASPLQRPPRTRSIEKTEEQQPREADLTDETRRVPPRSPQNTGVLPPVPGSSLPAGPAYKLVLSSGGTPIEDGHTYRQDDPRFSDGFNLILSVEYQGAVSGQTELSVEWYVGAKPVSFFPTLKVPNRAGRWSRAYDNHTVEAGQHRIVLKVDGAEGPTLSFRVDTVSHPAPER
jgi:hypothetical protein